MNKVYNISYKKLGELLLPVRLRQKGVVAILSAMMEPLNVLHRSFIYFAKSLDMPVNSQVCYMETMLNDKYDYYDRRILIRDIPTAETDFFLYDEPRASILVEEGVPFFWVDQGELASTQHDFEIVFPHGFSFTDDEQKQIVQLVNNHKLASKKFQIVYG